MPKNILKERGCKKKTFFIYIPMKKERAVTIKSPRLRMFRNNLRIILWLYKSKEWNRLFKEKEKILWNSDGSKHCLLNSEKLIVKEIQLEVN